jgi:hypothetical protein
MEGMRALLKVHLHFGRYECTVEGKDCIQGDRSSSGREYLIVFRNKVIMTSICIQRDRLCFEIE